VSEGAVSRKQLTTERRLVTILAADFVGFSRLMSRDEEGTARVLKAHRAVIDSIIELHGGSIFNTAGDSVLAEFSSPVQAVRSAVEIQEALRTRNTNFADDRRLALRIGVNLGDVLVRGTDLLGDAVNVAARLESIAETGGICIAQSVRDQIEGKLDLRFQALGAQQLKNIPRAVEVYKVESGPSELPGAHRQNGRWWGLQRPAVISTGLLLLVAITGASVLVWSTGKLGPSSNAVSAVGEHWLNGDWVGIIAREPISDPLFCSGVDDRCRVFKVSSIRADGNHEGVFGRPERPGLASISVSGNTVRIATRRSVVDAERRSGGLLEGRLKNERGFDAPIVLRKLTPRE